MSSMMIISCSTSKPMMVRTLHTFPTQTTTRVHAPKDTTSFHQQDSSIVEIFESESLTKIGLGSYGSMSYGGGGINECLKEVEIALDALDKPYNVLTKFTY